MTRPYITSDSKCRYSSVTRPTLRLCRVMICSYVFLIYSSFSEDETLCPTYCTSSIILRFDLYRPTIYTECFTKSSLTPSFSCLGPYPTRSDFLNLLRNSDPSRSNVFPPPSEVVRTQSFSFVRCHPCSGLLTPLYRVGQSSSLTTR